MGINGAFEQALLLMYGPYRTEGCLRELIVSDSSEKISIITANNGYKLQISTGFWLALEVLITTSKCRFKITDAFEWLFLHELQHIELGHFRFNDCFGIAQRLSGMQASLNSIPLGMRSLTPLCLEMQADHEATDILLGSYYTDSWHELREKVLAISGMMMLIELEDAKNNAEGRTHPRAATRIFQLLGHIAEMPLVEAQLHEDASLIPTESELQAFAHEVTIPCFFDALQLAQTTGALSIADDLGSPVDFFKDLEIAKLGDPSRYGDLQTQGAKEWAKLWPCNEALKPILGGHFTN